MNVKFIQILLLLALAVKNQDTGDSSQRNEGVIVSQIYKNPYLNVLSGIRNYCHTMFERVELCFKHLLIHGGEISTEEILRNCAGIKFEVVDKIFKETIERSFTIFMKIFSQRMYPMRYDFNEEISHFISRFRFMLSKNFMMYTSIQTSIKRANYFVDKVRYDNLIDILEPELLLFSKFQSRLKNDKIDLINKLKQLLIKRKADLDALNDERDHEHDGDSHSDGEHGNHDEHSGDTHGLEEELEHESSEIDQQLDQIHAKHNIEHLEEEIEHEIHKPNEEDKEKFVDYVEKDYSEQPPKQGKPAKVHAHHDDHHHPYPSYPKPEKKKEEGYFLDDGEESPYTKMERLFIPKDLTVTNDPF